MEMALESVGLGAVFLAPNRRFMLLVCARVGGVLVDRIDHRCY